jgi:hypothetical protein
MLIDEKFLKNGFRRRVKRADTPNSPKPNTETSTPPDSKDSQFGTTQASKNETKEYSSK